MKENTVVRTNRNTGDTPNLAMSENNRRGSRCTLLAEEGDDEHLNVLPKTLADNFERIPDLGPVPTFCIASKSHPAKPNERKSKGV